MLVLPHSERLRIYLDKLSKRVHKTAAYRDRATHRHVMVRELRACNF